VCKEFELKEALKEAKSQMSGTVTGNIGELVALFYDHFFGLFDDPDLASVATAAIINDLLSERCEVAVPVLQVA